MALRDLTLDLTPLRRSRDFRFLWVGGLVSSTGTQFTRVAVPYQVFQETGSLWALGLIGAVMLVPTLAASLIGGALADAHDRRDVARITVSIGFVCAVLLAWNASLDSPRVWLIYLLHALGTGGVMAGAPALRSSVPFLVDREDLAAATMVQSTTYTASSVVGPALAGIVIAQYGATWAFVVDAGSFLWSLVCITAMRALPPAQLGVRFGFGMITDGFRALAGRRSVIGSFLADLNAMVFGMPLALFPAIALARFPDDSAALGLLYSSIPFGMFTATVFSGWTRRVERHGLVVIVSVVVWGVAITLFGLADGLLVSLLCLAVAGAADMISGVSRQMILQLATTPELQGRMQGVGMAVWTSGPALGDLEAGGVAALTSVDTSVVLGGLCCIAGIGVIAWALPDFTRFRAGAGATDTPGAAEGNPAPA